MFSFKPTIQEICSLGLNKCSAELPKAIHGSGGLKRKINLEFNFMLKFIIRK